MLLLLIVKETLFINEDGEFNDESIERIELLHRNDKRGFARQNNLLPKTWVNIYIDNDTPFIVTGLITNLEEDMIEILTYPDKKTIYIDFG